jgi:hypothetical protein
LSNTTLRLGLGHETLAIRTEHPDLAAHLQHRYGPYAVDRPPTAELVLTGDHAYDPATAPLVAWRDGDGVWLGASGALTIRFDARQRRGSGRVTTDPDGLFSAVDNTLRGIGVRMLASAGLLLVHASGVVIDGRLMAFYGPSGVGKTTAARLAAAAGLPVAGDDLLIIDPARAEGGGSPFWGDGADLTPAVGWWPVHSLWRLEQAAVPARTMLAGAAAAAELMCQAPLPVSHVPEWLDGVVQLVGAVPHGRLALPRPTRWRDIQEVACGDQLL